MRARGSLGEGISATVESGDQSFHEHQTTVPDGPSATILAIL